MSTVPSRLFKGDWSKSFLKGATEEDTFHVTSDKSTRVPLMSKLDVLRFWTGNGIKALELPYGKVGDLSTVVILPDEIDGLSALETKPTPENLSQWLSGLGGPWRKVQVFLPRFKLTSQFSLTDVLKAMGMTLAFDRDKADLSGISSQEKLYISAVIHKAFVDVNEKGTEAAAGTGVVVGTYGVEPAPAVFRADHPFLFLIRDNRTTNILFVGRVVNPAG
jgi:serpin B